ncbi:2-C-methyl-D-erythritol 4-phosphate cytidylyltransferase/ 2C-methyl-D-erythritol 2,4-cyclodiphosphate synthase [Roseobacter sp. AzwK-3b]|uniref:bifunctional 2-C-methyl-D-erythritol 4-phosphate cytidylyltransferase/2-C-methyl-D-erythritol 2,4-cyclodiphosphate synthase n=1 Tax=Roseobacter sp. AzwK-3b TaxID=351016 RepID=UPI0001569103|nr:bifunctional 2-C-methyl-D-erythritol 4-phosphate cytidylyltransferase/2-C-methyl-D-erythritol 2,4-cyclodiphosphate synthase [Roseobacter sp. AzwK-3b]EDM70913.1 2-C-methyl-D-erythritol 4-phosphate cytidylyltransferase/ 2C-methyl-D-erythritol 2,4-cyclodiphosphate synthase [Roseobacter sp. AzwK-3b]
MTIAAIIVAAGRGTRAGGDMPKQWRALAGRRVIDWTVAAFEATPEISRIVVVLHPEDVDLFAPRDRVEVTTGAASRAGSVRNGLEYLDATPDKGEVVYTMIHDVARCCTKPAYVSYVSYELQTPGTRAVAPALPVTDALWEGTDGHVTGTRDRSGLYRAQTPQAFVFKDILAAHRAFSGDAADDVEVARAHGIPVRIIDGDESNLKITHAPDFIRAEKILRDQMDIRIGQGYDVHRFDLGDHVMLCGVAIPHTKTLQGHSDADVGMHALTDAIYGALAQGDIGRHFPPSDPQWKGAESHIFLRHAVELVREKGFKINNMDVTLICEHPKITPHAEAMIACLSSITGVAQDRISVKATTSERLGFTGREEGIAAQAAVTLVPA